MTPFYLFAQTSPSGGRGEKLPIDAEPSEALEPSDFAGAWKTVSNSLHEMWTEFLARLPLLVAAIIVLIITWTIAAILLRVARRALSRTRLTSSLRSLILQMLYIGIWVIGLTVAATVVFPGMTPAKILTVLGLSSIAIGFAFKDIVENFFAGILILWRFPFNPGDYIECEGLTGKVEETTIRMTTIRQVDGQLVVVPNAQLFKSPVRVITSLPARRVTIICGVAYDENVKNSRQVIKTAVQQCSTVNKDKNVEIFAQEFASSSVNFEVAWWTGSTPLEVRKSRDEVVEQVKKALDEAGIEIPFPYRTLTFKESLSIVGSGEEKKVANTTEEQA